MFFMVCIKCNKTKPASINFFSLRKNKSGEFYFRKNCKKCKSEYDVKYAKINIEKKKYYHKEYYENNIDKWKKYILNDEKRDIKKKNKKLWDIKNYEHSRLYKKEYNKKFNTGTSQTKPERKIEKYLIENNIEYEKEVSFSDCKFVSSLNFDFYIKNSNILIEFDGIQHYKPIFGKETFENQKLRDEVKTKYCLDKNIKLLRIPYWEEINLTKILEKEITK